MARISTSVTPKIAYAALVGRVIEHYRLKAGVNQGQIAHALGITQSAYSRLEQGQSAMNVVQLNAVATQLRMTPAQLLQDAERYVAHLRAQGVEITNDKQGSSGAGLLIALGLLAALIAAAGSAE